MQDYYLLHQFLLEPAKILFLNNAINHGILGPLSRTGNEMVNPSSSYLRQILALV